MIGQDVAVGRDDEARAHRLAGDAAVVIAATGPLPRTARHLEVRPEKAAEEFRHLIVIRHRTTATTTRATALLTRHGILAGNGGFDIDHTRADLLDQIGEVRQPRHQLRRWRCTAIGSNRGEVLGSGCGLLRAGGQRQGHGDQAEHLGADAMVHQVASDGRATGARTRVATRARHDNGREIAERMKAGDRVSPAGAAPVPAGSAPGWSLPVARVRTDRTPCRAGSGGNWH